VRIIVRSADWAVAVTVHHTSICRSKNFALFIVARMFILVQSKQKKGNNENLLSRLQINSKQTIIFVNETKNLKSYDEDIFLLHYEEVLRTIGVRTDGTRHCPRSSDNLLHPSYGTCGESYG
jgi:hypothetical protein